MQWDYFFTVRPSFSAVAAVAVVVAGLGFHAIKTTPGEEPIMDTNGTYSTAMALLPVSIRQLQENQIEIVAEKTDSPALQPN